MADAVTLLVRTGAVARHDEYAAPRVASPAVREHPDTLMRQNRQQTSRTCRRGFDALQRTGAAAQDERVLRGHDALLKPRAEHRELRLREQPR